MSSAEKVRITSAGKVGIGTDDPTYLLHVLNYNAVGSSQNDRQYNARFTTRTPNRLNLDIYDRRWENSQSHGWHGTEKRIEYNVDGNSSKRMWMSFINPSTTIQDNIIRFGEQEDTEWMRIDNGNVGIGTDDPDSKITCLAGSVMFGIDGTTNQYQGIQLRNGKDSSANIATGFIDFRNNLNIPDAYLMDHNTDGSSVMIFGTTPAGDRTTDRRAERLRIDR